VIGPPDSSEWDHPFRPMGPPAEPFFDLSDVFLTVARLQERNGDVSTDWSIFLVVRSGSSPIVAPGRLRRSAFRDQPKNRLRPAYAAIQYRRGTTARERWMARRY